MQSVICPQSSQHMNTGSVCQHEWQVCWKSHFSLGIHTIKVPGIVGLLFSLPAMNLSTFPRTAERCTSGAELFLPRMVLASSHFVVSIQSLHIISIKLFVYPSSRAMVSHQNWDASAGEGTPKNSSYYQRFANPVPVTCST